MNKQQNGTTMTTQCLEILPDGKPCEVWNTAEQRHIHRPVEAPLKTIAAPLDVTSEKVLALRRLRQLAYETNKAKIAAAQKGNEHDQALLDYVHTFGTLPRDATYDTELQKLGAL